MYGTVRGEPQKSYSDELNRLRACVALYKRSHGTALWIALRIFELDLKNGDEMPEEMPALTTSEWAELQDLVALTPAELSEEERVRDMNKNDVKKYAWLMEHLEARATRLVETGEATDFECALKGLRRDFWEKEEPWKAREFQAGLPSHHLKKRVYYSLVTFRRARGPRLAACIPLQRESNLDSPRYSSFRRFQDDKLEPLDAFEALARMKDVGKRLDETGVAEKHRVAARAFDWIVKSGPGRTEAKLAARRLAELRAKPFERLEADEGVRQSEEVDAKAREAEVTVAEVATALRGLADAFILQPLVTELLHGCG